MARFTFAAGNAGKVLRLPLYGLGALCAALVPRSPRIWAFGSGTGFGEGARPLAELAHERWAPELKVVWLAGSQQELRQARAHGLRSHRRDGVRGLWTTLRAQVLVVTHGFGDVNRYGVTGAFIVQLWHGIPLKRLHLDSPAALRVSFLPDHPRVRAVMAKAYRRAGRAIDLFPVASALVAARIVSAFGISPDHVVVTGDARDDALWVDDDGRAAHEKITSAIGDIPADSRIVLYAPTWRDGRADPAAPDPGGWDAIADWAERSNSVLLVRTHPLGVGDYAAGAARSPRIRLLDPELLRDLTPALPAVDVLVTDYSSVAFDFALLERPIVFLAPDVEEYAKRRGLYTPYREFSGGRHHLDWVGVLSELDDLADPGSKASADSRAHARWLAHEHFDHHDGRATERVLAEIRRHLASPRRDLVAPGRDPAGRARPLVVAADLEVDVDGMPALELELEENGSPVTSLLLEGPRAQVEAQLRREAGTLFASFRLAVSRWGGDELAMPSGSYRLTATGGMRSTRFELLRPTALVLAHELCRIDARGDAGGFRVAIAPPLDGDELGRRAQLGLEAHYRATRGIPEDAVFFESFYSQNASDNPLGIDRALARLRPEIRRYWSVVDRSIAVPPGAIPVVEGSREWWRVRAAARVLVVNDWLRKRYRHRRHQNVLQTWHGTMLKRLALDRPARDGLLGRIADTRTRIAVQRERSRWDALLAQNSYSAEIFRSAYAMDGPIWVEGYPRDDVLHGPDRAQRSDDVRTRLGLRDGERAVLYAPTWRDDRSELVDYLDVERFASELGRGWVVLVRGHSRTIRHGQDLDGPGLIDVTSYPDISELLLVAEVLVTDYSSVMFDWMSTDKPIVFFTPDLAHYSNDLRGFYFDLIAEAPGPVTTSPDGVREAILTAEAALPGFAARREVWRERFTPLDDGHAGERVVARMLDAGWLS